MIERRIYVYKWCSIQLEQPRQSLNNRVNAITNLDLFGCSVRIFCPQDIVCIRTTYRGREISFFFLFKFSLRLSFTFSITLISFMKKKPLPCSHVNTPIDVVCVIAVVDRPTATKKMRKIKKLRTHKTVAKSAVINE